MTPQLAERTQAALVRFDVGFRPAGQQTRWTALQQAAYEAQSCAVRWAIRPEHEHLPVHPRKASASKRRQRRNRLPYELHLLVPGAATVLCTPVWTDAKGPMERVYVVVARDSSGEPIRRPAGAGLRIVALLQAAFPTAQWDRPHTWRADTNSLTEFSPVVPAELGRAA